MNLNLILFLMLNVFTSCDSSKEIHNFVVTEYKRVEDGYQYSKDIFKYQGFEYKPIVSSEYFNDTLTTVSVYKSEGKIIYSKVDLNNDPAFKKMLNLIENRKIEQKERVLIDNGKSYEILESKKDSVFCKNKDNLILYHIR